MLSLPNLRALVAVADHGGIRQAAQHLGRTPSAVSMALKQIGSDLGAPLFEGERKSHPTQLGKLAIEGARDLLKHYDNMCEGLVSQARHEVSRCTIASVTSLAAAVLTEAIKRVQARSNGFEVMLREVHSTRMTDAVLEGVVDAAIGRVVGSHPDLVIEPLLRDRYNVVCAEDHPLALANRAVSWEEILRERIVANESYDASIRKRLEGIESDGRFHVSSVPSAFAMARAGVGVTIMPRIARSLAPPGIRFVDIQDETAFRTVGIFTRRGRTLSPAAKLLIEMVQQVVRENADRHEFTLLDPTEHTKT